MHLALHPVPEVQAGEEGQEGPVGQPDRAVPVGEEEEAQALGAAWRKAQDSRCYIMDT